MSVVTKESNPELYNALFPENEIKEILDKFDKVLENYELDKKFGQMSVDSICHLFPNEMITIKDCITNLEQENEMAIKELNILKTNSTVKPMKYQSKRKIELLYNSIYKGFHFYILNLGTHPTAYVEIPKKHKLFGVDYNDIDISVHGGFTYSRDNLFISENTKMDGSWFIGWDYAHCGDYYCTDLPNCFCEKNDKKWITEEIIVDCIKVIDQLSIIQG